MPYTSNPGGLFNSGVYPDTRPRIDVGSILDALGQGAGSIIHAAMVRKSMENEQGFRRAQLGLEQQREQREAAMADQDFQFRKEQERHRFIENGGIPGGTSLQNEPTGQAPITPLTVQSLPSSPIRQAMTGGAGAPPTSAAALPITTTPSASDTTITSAPATINTPTAVTTPDTYDPTRSAAYIRARDVAELHNSGLLTRDEARQQFLADQQSARLAAQQAGRAYAAQAAKGLYDYKRAHPMPKSATARAMTAGQEHAMHVTLAQGFIQAHGGDLNAALDTFRNSDEGKQLAAQGLTENDLLEGSTKVKPDQSADKRTNQILGLVKAGQAPTVEAADSTVTAARKLATPKTAGKATTTAPTGTTKGGTALPPLTDAQKKRAAADPEYKAFKIQQGYQIP